MSGLSNSNSVDSSNNKVRWNDEHFSFSTIDECEKYFEENYENIVEQNVEIKDSNKLSLLRSCIELLNRLEDTTNHLFAGRVLIFLARVIPLFDQSGVNLRSEFNVKDLPINVVKTLERINSKIAEKDRKLSKLIDQDIEEGETLSDDDSSDSTPKDDSDKIFERFWKIQKFLGQPNQLYDKNNWFIFRTSIDVIIDKMESSPAFREVWKLEQSYMTDSDTLSLQISDISMRRCFLTQILIVIQYLEQPVEMRPENLVLDEMQCSWSAATRQRIFGLLDTMPNQKAGRQFLNVVLQVLRREELWNKWKNDKCKEPKKPDPEADIVNMRGTYHKRRKISDELISAKPFNMHVIGSGNMTRLWNMDPKLQGKFLNKCSQKSDSPDLVQYLTVPEDKQNDTFKDPNYSFRALRLLRDSPHFFEHTNAAIQKLDVYLKQVAMRVVKDLFGGETPFLRSCGSRSRDFL